MRTTQISYNETLFRQAINIHIVFAARLLATLSCIFVLTPISNALGAQGIRGMRAGDGLKPDEQSVFSQVPREIMRPIVRAVRAIEEGDNNQAVSLLGQILATPMDEDYLVPDLTDNRLDGLNVGLRIKAQQMLASLPEKDLKSYRVRYGTKAKLALAAAIKRGDFDAIAQVMQRYFFTESGFSAAMILGHHHLDAGRPAVAANCFQRVVKTEAAQSIHDPAASVLLATCYVLAEQPERASEALVELKSRRPNGSIRFENRDVRLFNDSEKAIDWLHQLIGQSSLKDLSQVDQWVMFGGNPSRNARSGNGSPLITPNWEVPTINQPDLEAAAKTRLRELIQLGESPIPSLQPLAVGDTIVMRAFDRMVGVDFETGKREWVFPPWDLGNTTDPSSVAESKPAAIPKTPLTERIWQDMLYGQSSSDGNKIFFIPHPGFASEARRRSRRQGIAIPGAMGALSKSVVKREFNELTAINVARQGSFEWEVGGETGLAEPQLAKSFFLGPPLPLEGSLYVICQQDEFIKLVVLDSQTGKLQWSQKLMSIEAGVDVSSDENLRLAGVTPSFSNGILVCSTGACALVAIDLSTRSMLWGYQYKSPARSSVARISPNQRASQIILSGLWRESTITIADGTVIHTPIDAQNMICVDLQTGRPKFVSETFAITSPARNSSLYVSCVENGNAVLVGLESIRAVSISTGVDSWKLDTGEYGRPSGRGYVNRGRLYLPMISSQLLEIDLAHGKLLRTVDTGRVLGNLICYRDNVISHGIDRLISFPQEQPNRLIVETAEASGPLSPNRIALKSQLEYQAGNLHEAAALIADAYEQTGSPKFARKLVELIIQLIDSDFEAGIELASRFDRELFDDQYFEFEAARIDGMIKQRDLKNAMSSLLNLIGPTRSRLLDQELSIDLDCEKHDPSHQLNPGRRPSTHSRSMINMRLDRWIASRIRILIEKSELAEQEASSKKVTDYLASLPRSHPVEKHDLVRLFPRTIVSGETSLELADDLIRENELLRARQLLSPLLKERDRVVAAKAAIRMAKIYASANLQSQAIQYVELLESEFASIMIYADRNGNQAANDLVDQFDLKPTEQQSLTNKPRFSHAMLSDTKRSNGLNTRLVATEVELTSTDNPEIAKYRFLYYSQTGELEVLDAFGISIVRFLVRRSRPETINPISSTTVGLLKAHGDVLLLTVASELFAIDWLKLHQGLQPVLWNVSIEAPEKDQISSAISRLWGETNLSIIKGFNDRKIFSGLPSNQGTCYIDGANLVCVDTYSGTPYWQRTNFPTRSTLFGDEHQVVVWPPTGRKASIIDVASGRRIKQLELDVNLGSIWATIGTKFLMSFPQPASAPNLQSVSKEKTRNKDDGKESSNEGSDGRAREIDKQLNKVVGLYDLIEESFIWKRIFDADSLGCLTSDQRLAVLARNGNLKFVSLSNGEVALESNVDLPPEVRATIDGLGITKQRGQYLIHLTAGELPSRYEMDSGRAQIRSIIQNKPFLQGHLFAIDSQSGDPAWSNAVRFRGWQAVNRMPEAAPVHMLVRRFDRDNEDGRRRANMQIVLLDLTNGRKLLNYTFDEYYRVSYRLTWNQDNNQLHMAFPERVLKLNLLSDPDFPPTPLASLTDESTIPLLPFKIIATRVAPAIIAAELKQIRAAAVLEESNMEALRMEETRLLQNEKQ